MLIRARAITSFTARFAVLCVMTALLVAINPRRAAAEETVVCPPPGVPGPCVIVVITPGGGGGAGGGGGGGGGAGGGSTTCTWQGQTIPCYDPSYGWYNPTDECYWKYMSPQPPAGDPLWAGHSPSDGDLYAVACMGPLGPGFGGIGVSFSATAPPGYGGSFITPQILAQQAIAHLDVTGADIHMVPPPYPGGAGLVGLPVWMWTPRTTNTWGPKSATASAGGISVTATANGRRITWSMGDGHSVICSGVGTPYKTSYGNTSSPTCGYRYPQPSKNQPGGTYVITATTTFRVTWSGGGASGTATITRTSTTTVQITELQVVTK
jgi:hypothetical protein